MQIYTDELDFNLTRITLCKCMKMLGEKLKTVRKVLQKINLVKLIDDMEHDQELADRLEEVNVEIIEESERREMCQKAKAACVQTICDHLCDFLHKLPDSSYEEWIMKLHPDNTSDSRCRENGKIDHRFFVEESDHRLIWNDNMETLAASSTNRNIYDNRKVSPRYKHCAASIEQN